MNADLKRSLIIIVFIIEPWYTLSASDQADRSNLYQINFQQNLNSYQWLANIRYIQFIAGKGQLEIGENFNSSLIHIGRAEPKWRDDQQLHVKVFWPYSPVWGVKFSAAAYQFSDHLSGLVSDINTNWATLGCKLQPLSQARCNSDVGYKYDRRLGRVDQGTTYNINFETDPIILKEYSNQFHFLSKGDKFPLRENNDLEFQYQVGKNFQEYTIDSLNFYFLKKRRDNYDRYEINRLVIESLEDEVRGLRHNLIYGPQNKIQFRFYTLLNSRQTSVGKYDGDKLIELRSKKEFHSENEMGIVVQRAYMTFNISLNYETDSQRNDIPDSLKARPFSKFYYYISPNYQSTKLGLSTLEKFYFFKSDTLQFNGSISIFRYDTPENNMDDRDEFRANINLSEIHHFSPCLTLISNINVNLYHLVYIFGEKSANNNWMRIFRLSPQIIYQPSHQLSIAHHLEVLANYVNYDYETGASMNDLKSFIFRRFSMTQQVKAQLTSRSGISFNYKLELEENGKLNWDRWTQILLTSRATHWLRFNINYHLKNQMSIAPGILFLTRIEKQQTYFPWSTGPGGEEGKILSFGPTLKIIYQPHRKLSVSFEGLRRVVTRPSLQSQSINQFDMSLTWYN